MDLFGLTIAKKNRPHIKVDAGPDLLRRQKNKSVGFTPLEIPYLEV